MPVDVDLNAYCERIGYAGPRSPTLETLRAIQNAHVRSIPFENLDSLGGDTVAIDVASVERKLVGGRRGGYCFEHNTLLWRVLEQLGFTVSALAARVRWQVPADVISPLGHMALRVHLGATGHLVDAGFGGFSLTTPLDLAADGARETDLVRYRLTPTATAFLLEAELQGTWTALYQFDLSDHPARDFEIFNWYTCTSPKSTFVTSLMAASIDGGRRHTLLNARHTIRESGREPVVRMLRTAAELEEVLERAMGIRVPRSSVLRSKFEALIGRG